jgi:hypothetical protein
MARVRTLHALLLGTVVAVVIAPPASAADEESEVPAPTRAPADTITPLLMETGRPPDLSPRSGRFSFYVGGAATVTHRLSHRGRLLGSRTVTCPRGRVWRVRIDFDGPAQRRMKRLLASPRVDVLVWEMTMTDALGNVARRVVDVRV